MPNGVTNVNSYANPDNKKTYVLDNGVKKILWSAIALLLVLIIGTFFLQSGRIPFFTQNFLSLVVLVVIGIQAYIYRGQWDAMQDSIGRTDRIIEKMERQIAQMGIQSEVARMAAEIAQGQLVALQSGERAQYAALEETRNLVAQNERNLIVAERSLVLGSRAHVCLSDLLVEFGSSNRLCVKFENIGKVPAEKLKVMIFVSVSFPEPQWIVPNEVRGFSSNAVERDYGLNGLYPGTFKAELRILLESYLTQQEIALLAQQKGFLTVSGNLEYGDGFEETQHSSFAFTYRDGGWTMHPIWPDSTKKDDDEALAVSRE
jgi:hypothetical protein